MPPIRKIQITDDSIIISDKLGTKSLVSAQISSAQNSVAKVENWINTVWIPANIVDYQMVVHVFSINPLRTTVYCADFGITIPLNWWSL